MLKLLDQKLYEIKEKILLDIVPNLKDGQSRVDEEIRADKSSQNLLFDKKSLALLTAYIETGSE